MNQADRSRLDSMIQAAGGASLQNLAAAEAAVLRGQFNLAKVLRAVAHSQRIQGMEAARLLAGAEAPSERFAGVEGDGSETNTPFTSDSETAAQVRAHVADLVRRARESLARQSDVSENVVAQQIWGCYGCGDLIEGVRPEICPTCGALGVEFESFAPFYMSTPERLGLLNPAEILAILEAGPDEVESLLVGPADDVLREKPRSDQWSIKETVGHVVEMDRLFSRRLRTILGNSGMPRIDSPTPPWKLQEGKGYDDLTADELVVRFREARSASLQLVRGLTAEQWARRGTLRTMSPSVLEMGTWLANHDRGHLAQIRQLRHA